LIAAEDNNYNVV